MVPQPPLPNERYAIKAADGHACIGDGVHSSPMGLSLAAGKVIGAKKGEYLKTSLSRANIHCYSQGPLGLGVCAINEVTVDFEVIVVEPLEEDESGVYIPMRKVEFVRLYDERRSMSIGCHICTPYNPCWCAHYVVEHGNTVDF
jgi:hypothetical protein